MKVALVQMVSSQKVEVNLKEAESLIAEAAATAEFVFLPQFPIFQSVHPMKIAIRVARGVRLELTDYR